MNKIIEKSYWCKSPIHTDSNVRLVRGREYHLIQRNWDIIDVYDDRVYYGAVSLADAIENFKDIELC